MKCLILTCAVCCCFSIAFTQLLSLAPLSDLISGFSNAFTERPRLSDIIDLAGFQGTRMSRNDFLDTVRRLVKLKVAVDENGVARQVGLTLQGCLRDPPLDRLLFNNYYGQEACEKCMTTVGTCCKHSSFCHKKTLYEDDITSYRGYRLVATNGIPDHSFRGNNSCEFYRAMLVPIHTQIPRNESKRIFKVQPPGMVGIAVTGGFIFNDLTIEGRCGITQRIITEETGDRRRYRIKDSCGGHGHVVSCQYHYHGPPRCVDDSQGSSSEEVGSDACRRLGYMHDGIPIHDICEAYLKESRKTIWMRSCYRRKKGSYGCRIDDWEYVKTKHCNLDRANGYLFEEEATSSNGNKPFFKGVYVYFYSKQFPFAPPYYAGENPRYGHGDALCGISPTGYRYPQPNEFYQRLCIRGRAYGPDQPVYVQPPPPPTEPPPVGINVGRAAIIGPAN